MFLIWNFMKPKYCTSTMGLLQQTVTWYKMRHAGGQAISWDIKNIEKSSLTDWKHFVLEAVTFFCPPAWQILCHVMVCCKRPIVTYIANVLAEPFLEKIDFYYWWVRWVLNGAVDWQPSVNMVMLEAPLLFHIMLFWPQMGKIEKSCGETFLVFFIICH